MKVHSFACSKLPRQNMMNDVRLFSRVYVMLDCWPILAATYHWPFQKDPCSSIANCLFFNQKL